MLLYRSLVVGLLGALLALEVERGVRPVARADVGDANDLAPTVVDVSRAALEAAALDPEVMVGARPGERVVRVRGVLGEAPSVAEAWAAAGPEELIDVELARGKRIRRVLVLVHR